MATKLTLVIDNPADVDAFEKAFPEILDLSSKLPGLEKTESSLVWPKEDGTPTPAHRQLDLYFADYDAASAAVSGPEAGAFFGAVTATNVPFKALFNHIGH